MKVTVCELPGDPDQLDRQWQRLAAHTRVAESDLVLLPEMPFSPWLAASNLAEPRKWQAAIESHSRWIARLPELRVSTVIGTRPVTIDDTPYNQCFVWTSATGATAAHTKYYLPDETGFWEATWYRRGEKIFKALDIGGITCGFLVCTETLVYAPRPRVRASGGAHHRLSTGHPGIVHRQMDHWRPHRRRDGRDILSVVEQKRPTFAWHGFWWHRLDHRAGKRHVACYDNSQ